MKNLFYFFFLFLTIPIFSQSSFAPTGAEWIFPERFFGSANSGIIKFSSTGDTIIQNKSCQVVFKATFSCYIPNGEYYFHQSNDSVFLYNETLELFELLYDFGAEVGESWTFSASDGTWGDTMTCFVDSISYYSVSTSDSLKIQHVTLQSEQFFIDGVGDTIYRYYKTKLIENIGFELALLPIQFLTICDGNYERELRCYEDNEIGLINFSNVDCLMTPIETFETHLSLSIFPNPTQNSFFIKNKNTNQEKLEYELIDFRGVTILKNQTSIFPNQSAEVKTAHLPAGIYFLKIQNNNTFTIQKIIISR